MAYGLQAFNSNGEFLLTDTYVKPWFMAKGTISSVIGPYQIDFQESTDGGSTYTQKNFRAYTVNYTIPNHNAITKTGYAAITLPNTNIFYSPQIYWQSGSGFSIDVLVPTNITATATDTPEVYLFCIENINAYSTSGYGLQIFNSSSQCMYDSNYQAFRPIYAIGGTTPFPYFGSPFIGSNPKIGSLVIGGVSIYDFSSFSTITKPIYVLPPFTYYIQVKEQTDPIYTIASGDPYWQYTFKTFYIRSSNNTITSKAYYNQSFYEPEASSGQTWTSYGNAQNYVIISDGNRYSTSSGGTFPNATYTLSVSPTSPLEGTNFTITLTTTNVPNGTTFNWTLTGDTLTSTDFSGNYSSGTMTVQSNSSSVTFTPLIDAVNDTEQYVFELFDSNGLVIKSLTFTVTNTATPTATYSLSRTPATGNINEGDSFTITVATTYVEPGTVLNYTVGSNFDSLDGNNLHVAGTFPALSGTFQSASTSKTFVTSADNRTDGFKTFTLTLSHGSNPSISIGVNDSSQSAANGEMLDLSTTTPSRNEGQSASVIGNWNFGSYIYDGRSFKLQIASSSAANSSDATISPSGFVALTDIYSGGELIAQRRVWTVSITEDQTTESATESLILEVVDTAGYTYDTQTITISDTSKTPAPTVSFYSSSPAVDGGTGLIYLNETNNKTLSLTVTLDFTAANTPVYWKTNGSANFTLDDVDTSLNGTIYTVVGQVQRTLPNITIKTDYTTEAVAESFTIGFYSDSSYTTLLYESPTVSVNDTSQTPTLNVSNVSITPNPVDEGNSTSIVFTIQDSITQNIYFKIVGGAGFTGGDVSSYTPSNNTFQSATGAGAQRTITVTLNADSTTEGTEQFYIYFFTTATWNNGSPVDANRWGSIGPINVTDTSTTPITRTFTRSVSEVNEGGSFSITFTTNQAGSFNYSIIGIASADIGGASLTGSVSNGTVLNYTATSDLTTEGDETFTIRLDDYTNVNASVIIRDTSLTAAPSAASISLNTLGQSLSGSYISSGVYWTTWTLSSQTTIIFSTEHELPIGSNGTDTTIAVYNSTGILQHTTGAGDDDGVDGRGVNFSSRLSLTLPAGTYYGAIGVYPGAYSFSNYWTTTGFSATTLNNNISNIRVSLWTGTPQPQLQGVSAPNSVNEGDTATFSFTLLDTLDRTLYWRIVGTNTSAADFSGSTSGSWANQWPRSSQNLSITTVADATTESTTESFKWQLSTTSDFSDIFYDTASSATSTTINDTSQTPVPTWSFGSVPGDLGEGVQYSVTFNATNWNGNTAYFYIVAPDNGGTSAASEVTLNTSSVSVNSNSYSTQVYFTPNQDFVADGEEWFRVQARNGAGTTLATSGNMKVVSNAAPSYTFGAIPDSMNEGTGYAITFTANSIRNRTFTFGTLAPTSGTDASAEVTISPTSIVTSSSSNTSIHTITVTPNVDGVESTEYFRFGAYLDGSALATASGNIAIPGSGTAPSGTFSVSPSSHTGYSNISGTWSISGNPTPSVRIDSDQGFESTNWGTQGSGQILEYNVGATTTYTLTATNAFGTLTLSSTSTVPGVSASLSASPTSITSGNSSTLTWSTTNATSASISGIGNVSPVSSGSVSVSPTSTTTYTLTASNVQNSAQASATVTVTAVTYYSPSVILTPSRSGYTTQQCNGVASNLKLINAPPNTVVNFSGTTSGTITTNSSGEWDFGSYTLSNFTGNWTFVFSNSGNGLVSGGQTQNYSVSWVDCTVGPAWYNIVSVTGSNGSTNGVSPVNQYYRRQIIAFTYSAAEITAATGKTSGTIQQLRFYVSGVPTNQPYPNWAIGLKNHSNGTSNDPGNTGYAIVWGPESTSFYSGYNTFDIANFSWSGGNLGITFAWGQVPVNWTSTGQSYVNNTGNTYLSQTDAAGTYTINSDGYSTNTSGRPAIEIYI